jgi:putative transposase
MQVIVDYITCYRDRFGVEPICAGLTENGITIAPSTYYAYAAQGSGLPTPSGPRPT